MSDYIYVEDKQVDDNDVVLVMNDVYSLSDHCDYVIPVSESENLNYEFTKPEVDNSKDTYFNIEYDAV